MTYLLFFLAGAFGINSIPHLTKGVTGERHMTPFGKPSGAGVNVLWGLANAFLATWLLYWATNNHYRFGYAVAAAFSGAAITGLALAMLWRHDDEAKGGKQRKR